MNYIRAIALFSWGILLLAGCAAETTSQRLAEASAQPATAPATAPATRPARKPPMNVKSPEVSPDGMITLRLLAPKARDVKVWTEWEYKERPLAKDEDGVWSVTMGPIANPNTYLYWYIVDSVKILDPHNPKTPPYSYVEIGESVARERQVPRGVVQVVRYYSESLDSERRMHVYLPPHFNPERKEKYPVLYLLHGQGNSDEFWVHRGLAPQIMDNLIAEKKAVPMIVVMPDGHNRSEAARRATTGPATNSTTSPTTNPTTSATTAPARRGRGGPRDPAWGFSGYGTFGVPGWFSDDMLKEILPYVESHYNASSDPAMRAIGGASMGGNQSVAMGLKHLGTFKYVLSFSGAIGPTPQGKFEDLIPNPQAVNDNLTMFWIAMGTADRLHANCVKFNEALDQAGVRYVWHETAGGHGWPEWRDYLAYIAPKLFGNDAGAGQ